MNELAISEIAGLALKIFALMTPTAVLSYFITHTRAYSRRQRLRMAIKTGLAMFIIGEALFISGAKIFIVFGFTADAFGIGVGVLLFLSAVKLMNDEVETPKPEDGSDFSVVPLAIPLGMGPATIGWLMVLGSEIKSGMDVFVGTTCIIFDSMAMTALLCLSEPAYHLLGKTGIVIMAKLTALLLSAMAAQVVFSGIRSFLIMN